MDSLALARRLTAFADELLVPIFDRRASPFEGYFVSPRQILQPPRQQVAAISAICRGDNHAGLGEELCDGRTARFAPSASGGNVGGVIIVAIDGNKTQRVDRRLAHSNPRGCVTPGENKHTLRAAGEKALERGASHFPTGRAPSNAMQEPSGAAHSLADQIPPDHHLQQ
jgi:hypothetical protein